MRNQISLTSAIGTHSCLISTQVTCLGTARFDSVPHPRSGSKKEWLNSYQTHSAVDTLYTKFLKEIDARYGAATRVHLCSQVDGDFRRAKRRWAGA